MKPTVHGLRMFTHEATAETAGGFQVFYSRRSDGPYYRWWYEQRVKQWRSTRVHEPEFSVSDLSGSSWRNLPDALQISLIDHYLE